MEAQVVGVVGMHGVVHPHLNGSQRVSRADLFPGRTGTPSVTLCGGELEGAVLYQLGIEAAISRVVDVLEEDADQFVTNLFATLRGCHGLLGAETHGGSCKACSEKGSFVHIVNQFWDNRVQRYE